MRQLWGAVCHGWIGALCELVHTTGNYYLPATGETMPAEMASSMGKQAQDQKLLCQNALFLVASGVKPAARAEPAVQEEQRLVRKLADIDRRTPSKRM